MQHKNFDEMSVEELLVDVRDIVIKDAQDIADWMKHQQIEPGTALIPAADLYDSYQKWASNQGEIIGEPVNPNRFGIELSKLLQKRRRATGVFYEAVWGVKAIGEPLRQVPAGRRRRTKNELKG